MTPAAAIAMLDQQIHVHGQDITLRRPVANAAAIEKPFRAFVRGYRPDELAGGLQQGDTQVVLSPTGLPAEFADADATRLRKLDRIIFDGRTRTVKFVEPVRIAGTLVRMNVTVEG